MPEWPTIQTECHRFPLSWKALRRSGQTLPKQWYSYTVLTLIAILAALFYSHIATAPKTISLPTEDGGVIFADVYGTVHRHIVLPHQDPFNHSSWPHHAQTLPAAGLPVFA